MVTVIDNLQRKAVNLHEAAGMLGVSVMTIRRAIRAGKIKAVRFVSNGPYRIPITELDRFLSINAGKNVADL